MKPLLLPLALLVAAATAAPAFAAQTRAVTPNDISEVQTLEEIVVSGDVDSLYQARKAIVDAEDRFYERYNQLNKDRRFDITCTNEAPTGTKFRFRQCYPRIVDDATHENMRDSLNGMSGRTAGQGGFLFTSLDAIRATYVAELKRRMLQMLNEDPALMRALLERARLEQHYETLRREKFKGRVFVRD